MNRGAGWEKRIWGRLVAWTAEEVHGQIAKGFAKTLWNLGFPPGRETVFTSPLTGQICVSGRALWLQEDAEGGWRGRGGWRLLPAPVEGVGDQLQREADDLEMGWLSTTAGVTA